jgi:hypothetical protein
VSEPVTSSESDPTVRLLYLDMLFATFQRVEASTSRLSRLQVILSILVIALASGLVSADENLELTGIKLKLPLWTVLGGGAIVVGFTAALAAVQETHASLIKESLFSGYEDLGFPTAREDDDRGLGLASGSLIGAATSPALAVEDKLTPVAVIYGLGAFAVVLVLPCAAQVVAMLKLGGDFGWSWTVWLPLGASLLFTVASLVWAWREGGV